MKRLGRGAPAKAMNVANGVSFCTGDRVPPYKSWMMNGGTAQVDALSTICVDTS